MILFLTSAEHGDFSKGSPTCSVGSAGVVFTEQEAEVQTWLTPRSGPTLSPGPAVWAW